MKKKWGISPDLANMPNIPTVEPERLGKGLTAPVWTENKAQLIQRYLHYFVLVTKHGTYLDLFAGPQKADFPETWAAKLVLENEPKWINKFALFELEPDSVAKLKTLAQEHRRKTPKRSIRVIAGDSNVSLPEYLRLNGIMSKTATFCLLDQRTFECDWKTVETIARHKKRGNKIELFYFLAQGWLNRTVRAYSAPDDVLTRWWGNKDWGEFVKTPWPRRGLFMAERFKNELKYKFAHCYAIYEKQRGGKVMFYMVHASDHPQARPLMVRAYRKSVAPLESVEQLEMEFPHLTGGGHQQKH